MRKIAKAILLGTLVTAGAASAQIANLPQDGLVGHWAFDDAGSLLDAAVGNPLSADHVSGDASAASISAVPGPAAGNGAARIELGTFLRAIHDIEANGGGLRVNEYSMVMDIQLTVENSWYGIFAGDNGSDATASDWEIFLRPGGRAGVGSIGYTSHEIAPEDGWYRMVISAKMGEYFRIYLDGQITRDPASSTPAIQTDERFSLDSPDESNQVLLFGDNDGEDAAIDVAEFALYDRPLTHDEIVGMGGYDHVVVFDDPIVDMSFDDAADLDAIVRGSFASVSAGNLSAVEGPAPGDGAVAISPLTITHGVSGRGLGEVATKVNQYTLTFDIRRPEGAGPITVLQAEAGGPAVLEIDGQGRIGSGALGFSQVQIQPNLWYKVTVAVNAGSEDPNVTVYFDGLNILSGGSFAVDGAWGLGPQFTLFGSGAAHVAGLAMYNKTFSSGEAFGLGGFEKFISDENTPARQTLLYKIADDTQYAIVPYSEDFDIPLGRSFTVETWIWVDPVISSDPSFISNKDWDSGGNNGWNMAAKSGTWDVNIADDTRARTDFDPPTLNDQRWHHVGFVVDGDARTIAVWTDDLVQGPIPLEGAGPTINPDNFPLAFAQDGTEGYPAKFPGMLDEIRIYHAALDMETVKAWRHRKITDEHPFRSALVGYWDFDNIQDGVIPDLSGNGHNATIVGAPQPRVSYAVLGDQVTVTLQDVAAIWGVDNEPLDQTAGTSGMLTISSDFDEVVFNFADQKSAVFGHNGLSDLTTEGSPVLRMKRAWYTDLTETFAEAVDLSFELAVTPGVAGNYRLLGVGRNGGWQDLGVAASVEEGAVEFSDVTIRDGWWYTIGTTDRSASPLDPTATAVTELGGTPVEFALSQNYPNPFNPETTITFSLAQPSDVRIVVTNALGQQVATLVDEKARPAGNYKTTWDAADMAAGLYFYTISAGEFSSTRRMLLIK
jgi:hypothetical protein